MRSIDCRHGWSCFQTRRGRRRLGQKLQRSLGPCVQKLVNITRITRVYGRYLYHRIYTYFGFKKQRITMGVPPCATWFFPGFCSGENTNVGKINITQPEKSLYAKNQPSWVM